jgi:MazG family protein
MGTPSTSTIGEAVERLYDLTLLLRRECPWDREQTAATIVPHTLEEAYEVADVVHELAAGNAQLPDLEDELGDLLFQVCFLAMWCQEQNPAIDLGSVAAAIHEKLVRRHPHVFEQDTADSADEVRQNWDAIKRDQERKRDLFGGIPKALPSLGRAQKVQQRASGIGFDFKVAHDALAKLEEEVTELRHELERSERDGSLPTGEHMQPDAGLQHEIGDVLFAAVNVARLTRSDPELALRTTVDRWISRVERARELATAEGEDFARLELMAQDAYYTRAKADLAH